MESNSPTLFFPFSPEFLESRVKNVLNQCGFSGSGDSGDAYQNSQGDAYGQVFEVMLTGSLNGQKAPVAGTSENRSGNGFAFP